MDPWSNDGQMIKVVRMGFSRKRIGRYGKPRYTAYYLDIRGQERSAGTFPNKKDANERIRSTARFKLSGRITAKIQAHVTADGRGDND